MKNKSINKIVIVSLGLIIILIIAMKCFIFQNSKVKTPVCENGFLDLSNWDFKNNGNVKLDGEWEFYPNMLLSPKDINSDILSKKLYVDIPNPWISQLSNNIISERGIGTYRIKVRINKKFYMYGLKTTRIRSASKIFVNGREVAKSGNPKASFEDGYSANVVPVIAIFPSDSDTLDIIIQVANLDYYNGGIIQSIYLGNDANILDYYFKTNMFDMISISFLVMFGIYYLGIYVKRKNEKNFMYLGIACITYSYIFATSSEKIFNKIFTFIPFMLILKVNIATVCLVIYFIIIFIRECGKDFIPNKYMKVISFIVVTNIVSVLVIPISLLSLFENIIGILNTLISIFIALLIGKAIVHKKYGELNRRGVIFLFCGIILWSVQYIASRLYFFSLINNDLMPIITFFIVLIGGYIMLLEQYVKAYSDLEIMSNNLIKADKMKDEFFLNTSNELKTPLHAIINIAQTMRNKSEKNTLEFEENLSHIISISTRLSSVVNDIIDLQNLQNGSLKFDNKIFDVNGAVQMVVDILSYMRKGEDIKLINNIDAGKYYVYTDENRFNQIIFNIIGNSLKYTEKGYIQIKADIRENYVYISVEDTGIGIDKNLQKNLFKRNVFKQETKFSKNTSSGLGLSISKLLATNMGGDLYLKWSEFGKGTIFNFVIPKADVDKNTTIDTQYMENKGEVISENIYEADDSNKSIYLQQNSIKDSKVKKSKILIVDDEASNIMVLKQIFYEDCYETIVAYNGITALELLKKHKDISIVLLDVMMPGLSGYEVCKKIREDYQMFEIPILLFTIRNTSEDIEAGLEAGANDILVKPFNSKELKTRVKTLLKLKDTVSEALKMETIFLQSQIKPHFLYNSLSVIISLCYSDGERAGKLIGELSNYLRLTFTIDPYNSYMSLEKEISLIKSYIEIEKARFGDRLKIELNIDERLLEYRIPALIIQPIVENSICHGLMKRISGGTVKITAKKSDDFIEITVKDDGVGIQQERLGKLLNNSFTGSIGLKNVNKRLFNEYGQGILINSEIGVGTIVTINIPIKV